MRPAKGGTIADTRAAAATVVAQVLEGASLNQVLPAALDTVASRDRSLLQQLCYGTLREYPRLQPQLARLLAKPLRSRDREVEALLLAGLYQLSATRIPDHAAVAATVAAATALSRPWAKGLCNAVLRRYLREREVLAAQLDDAAAAAHPQWLYQAIHREWPQQAAAIIAANNAQPPMVLRVNRRLGSREDYLATLAANGIEASAGSLAAEAIYLAQPMDVSALPGFADGRVSIQDEAAQLAARLLQATPGDRVLDACAAPGGKTCHLLELDPTLRLVAMDVDPQRLRRVRENLQRLSLDAEVLTEDAAAPVQLQGQRFQRILVDAPCSASGVVRRHPDIKVLRRPADIGSFAAQQLAILRGLWPLLAPGGRLLYVTCSVLEEENSGVLQQFLQATPEAILLPAPVGELRPCGGQLLPQVQGPDGLFYGIVQRP
ncbi:16S rRNA (cytosine(967)-C(5))-methyltransferase RsmB [Kineobactrum salinum]|uniref:16S rRNA (cytosine(967)-C(5))-methyltransferase n=1 Tax=Kineobactrum salinum TaxID=2708301 RepID=A0A6C0U184_9GAMM|nr:16S rRNA (cytosine(967)-C(5))-methyltransferase RsmB [Kineobactrum salinum]QIB65658.1 16S rRNA (cytosine(967)-C(5))-methyltransferase RsmB [Kineobactrum salinum]